MDKPDKVDTINFSVLHKSYQESETDKEHGRIPFLSTQISINHKNLIAILREYEEQKFPPRIWLRDSPYHPIWHPAGNYEGIGPRSLYRQLKDEKGLRNGKVWPYQCRHHLNDDWQIRFKMQVSDKDVIWDNFRLITTSHGIVFEKKYADFGEFTFLKTQFEESLEKLSGLND